MEDSEIISLFFEHSEQAIEDLEQYSASVSESSGKPRLPHRPQSGDIVLWENR